MFPTRRRPRPTGCVAPSAQAPALSSAVGALQQKQLQQTHCRTVPTCSHGALPPDPLLTHFARKGAQLPGWCTKRRGLNACCRASARLRSVVTAEVSTGSAPRYSECPNQPNVLHLLAWERHLGHQSGLSRSSRAWWTRRRAGRGWLHEIKYDGYRMHARIEGRDIKLLTRTGLDWSHQYRRTIEALAPLTGAHTHSGLSA